MQVPHTHVWLHTYTGPYSNMHAGTHIHRAHLCKQMHTFMQSCMHTPHIYMYTYTQQTHIYCMYTYAHSHKCSSYCLAESGIPHALNVPLEDGPSNKL